MEPTNHLPVAQALADVAREALERGEAVALPNLGAFTVNHQPSTLEKRPDGTVALHPPQNTVAFEADS